LDTGWAAVWNGGDPTCPPSIYAARHTGAFNLGSDTQSNVAESLPSLSPDGSTPRPNTVASFSRAATLESSSHNRNENTMEISYSFQFSYRAWPYGLPLWFTDVSISFDKTSSVPIYAKHPIVGKKSGSVHQDMNAVTDTSFSASIGLQTSRRKARQFSTGSEGGSYLSTILAQYADFILGKVFLERAGYGSLNVSSESSSQNAYYTSDTFNEDVVNGSLTRSTQITMLDPQT